MQWLYDLTFAGTNINPGPLYCTFCRTFYREIVVLSLAGVSFLFFKASRTWRWSSDILLNVKRGVLLPGSERPKLDVDRSPSSSELQGRLYPTLHETGYSYRQHSGRLYPRLHETGYSYRQHSGRLYPTLHETGYSYRQHSGPTIPQATWMRVQLHTTFRADYNPGYTKQGTATDNIQGRLYPRLQGRLYPDRVQKVDCSVERERNLVTVQGGREVTYSLWQYCRALHG